MPVLIRWDWGWHTSMPVLTRWDGSDRCNCDENGEKYIFVYVVALSLVLARSGACVSSCFAIAYDGDGGGGMH
jgi:hypothetical protein